MKSVTRMPFTRGWVIVAACLIGVSTGPAAFILSSMGLFLEGFQTEFGWTRTEVGGALSLMMMATAVSLPFAGKLIDMFGVRRVLIPSVILLALLLMAVPFVTQLWQLMGLYLAIGGLAVGSNSVGYMRLLGNWFDRRRGLAIGIAGSGTGLGFAYVPLVTQAAVASYGWRGGYVVLGLIILTITLPLILVVLRERPGDVGLTVDGDAEPVEHHAAEAKSDGYSLVQALHRRDFWFMMITFMSVAFVLYGVIPHMVPLLEGRGLSTADAAWISSLFGLATFGGRILIGWLIDRYDPRFVAFVFFGISGVGMALLAMDLPLWAVVLAAAALGGSLGAEVDMLAYLTSRYFGLRCFSQIFGVLFSAVMVTMGLGPVLFGAVFDATGSYSLVIAAGVPACLLSMLTISLLAPRPVRKTSGLRGATIPQAQ